MPATSKSSITIDPAAPPEWVKPHPGEHLREDYLAPLNMSAAALARSLGVPTNRVTEILNGERGISADSAWRLARFWGTTPQFWLNLQQSHDLSKTWIEHGNRIAIEVSPRRTDQAA